MCESKGKLSGPERRIEKLKRSVDADERLAGWALDAYVAERRTEGAFYIRFCAMAPCHATALGALWGISDRWRLFRRLCRFFGI